ncbi:MAG: MucB/RseB C-terminal domain-containing protein [Parasulfuritortus sp.]|jgi:sigma-E factor negative regulatory protein RseB|nr:MucB/RseB C-terminal domain-containing protein [Parasulfuritortus sp.]
MKWLLCLLALIASPAWAGEAIPDSEAASWLTRMSDASRKLPYEGIFVMQMGDRMQTVQVENRPNGLSNESRLVVLDGQPREVRCTQNESVTLAWGANGQQVERRIGSRHFPDLLPENPAKLVNYYSLHLGKTIRVAGQECQLIELVPKDQYRWGYRLCAEQYTGLPLKAVMVGDNDKPLLQYAFVKVREGVTSQAAVPMPAGSPADDLRPVVNSPVVVKQLPPGYVRLIAVKRKLPNHDTEVEHWIFSDGLSHISMFVEAAPVNMVSVKGQSTRGLMNLMTRKVGRYQVTVLGDAPSAAVDFVAMNLEQR